MCSFNMRMSIIIFVLSVAVVCPFVQGFDRKSFANVGLHHPDHLRLIKTIVNLHHGNFTKDIVHDFPPGFEDHPGTVDRKNPVCLCNYATNKCLFNPLNLQYTWTAQVNNQSAIIDDSLSLTGDPQLIVVNIVSNLLYGTQCLFFSTYSDSVDISFAVSFLHDDGETTTPISGLKNSIKKVTVGVGTDKPYRILFHVYAFGKNGTFHKFGRPGSGIAIIGKIRFTPGPCSRDQKSLDCDFNYGICHWILHDRKYIWYPLPFGRDHDDPHKIEWGAVAAFGGEGNMWSPIIRSIAVRCFSFIYAKGVSDQSFLRVWLLFKIPGLGPQRLLLFEDVSFHKVIKKLIQINLFVPFHFQIAFEGRSKTILHGVVILDTSITNERCKGIGFFSDVRKFQIAPTPGNFTFKPSFTLKPKSAS